MEEYGNEGDCEMRVAEWDEAACSFEKNEYWNYEYVAVAVAAAAEAVVDYVMLKNYQTS